MGAAYGAVVSSVLSFCIMFAVLNKTIGVNLGETFRYVGFAYREMLSIIKKLLGRNDGALP
jgi:hypothetical protein